MKAKPKVEPYEGPATGRVSSWSVSRILMQVLDDFDKTDCIFSVGHSANPQNPTGMVTTGARPITDQYHQLKAGGDTAPIVGICKAVIASDDAARKTGRPGIRDVAFVERQTHGFDDFADFCRRQDWAALEGASALSRDAMEEAAETYMDADAVMANCGMGVSRHEHGGETVKMIVNLLLRGNIGKPEAGICPMQGRQRIWGTPTAEADFTVPDAMPSRIEERPDVFRLVTLRADSRFCAEDARFRGVHRGRNLLFMNHADMKRSGLAAGDTVMLAADADDGVNQELGGLEVVPHCLPEKCIAACYPERDVLVPRWHHAKSGRVPATKTVPVRIRKQAAA